MSDDYSLSREEWLGGSTMHLRRATIILFAIETRTNQLAAQSLVPRCPIVAPSSLGSDERDQAFLGAMAQVRQTANTVSVQDLERHAPKWSALVPQRPAEQAALALVMSQKYVLPYEQILQIRDALCLDHQAVQEAFQQAHHRPLSTIYRQRLSLKQQLTWFRARAAWTLESIPPFWMAFALTFTETVGATIVALPIALAGIGPLAGIIILAVLGLVNVLTIAGMSEAIVRNGNIRYGTAYFGQLVSDYLGHSGAWLLTFALMTNAALILMAYYIGFSTTLGRALNVSPAVLAVLLFVMGVLFLRRESMDVTAAMAILVVAVNVTILIVIMLLALPHIQLENLAHMRIPFVNGVPFDVGLIQLIFGVVLTAYFGHTSAASAAKVVLARDSSGKSFLWGSITAMICAVVLYSVWVIVVNGAVAPDVLQSTTATAFVPLAAMIGPQILALGSVFAVLGMGLSSVFFSLALFSQMREWLSQLAKRHSSHFFANKSRRFWFSLTPVIVIFLLTEWLLLTGNESFTGVISTTGVVAVPILGGIFPVLMLSASRRKGDYVPQTVLRFLDNSLVRTMVYGVFFVSILAHGLVIWQNPLQKAVALAASLAVVIVTVVMIRRRAFGTRLVIEVRMDEPQDNCVNLNIVTNGQPLPTEVRLNYSTRSQTVIINSINVADFKALRSISVDVPPQTRTDELKVWVHQSNGESALTHMASQIIIQAESEQRFDLSASHGHFIQPLSPKASCVEIQFTNHAQSQPSLTGT
jgi:amino acid permease